MAEQELLPKEKQELREEEQVRPGRYYVPDVDIYEDKEALWLYADVPGAGDPARVSVELHDDKLTLQAEVALQDYDGLSPVYTEYNVGHFLRRFHLADSSRFDAEGVSARLSDGVLELRLPKTEKAKPRRIEVKGA